METSWNKDVKHLLQITVCSLSTLMRHLPWAGGHKVRQVPGSRTARLIESGKPKSLLLFVSNNMIMQHIKHNRTKVIIQYIHEPWMYQLIMTPTHPVPVHTLPGHLRIGMSPGRDSGSSAYGSGA